MGTKLRRFAAIIGLGVYFLTLSTLANPTADPITLTGKVIVLSERPFVNGRISDSTEHEVVEFIRDENQQVFRIDFAHGKPQFKSGDRVRVRGKLSHGRHLTVISAGDLTVLSSTETPIDRQPQAVIVAAAAEPPKAIGTNLVLIVRISSSTEGTPFCSAQQLVERLYTGPTTTRGYFQEVSYGKLMLDGDLANDGTYDLQDVTISYTTDPTVGCSYGNYSNQADAKLREQGFEPNNYNQRLYILPRDAPCGVAGALNYYHSWFGRDTCNYVDAVAHELGHNYGLGHAGDDVPNIVIQNDPLYQSYVDLSCVMGTSFGIYRHFNAPHKAQLNWIPSHRILDLPSGGGTYTLMTVESDPLPLGPEYTLLRAARGSVDQYFVSYREELGPYSGQNSLIQYKGKVSIHHAPPTPAKSYLIRTLLDGESFCETFSGMAVTHLSHGNAQASVRVNFGYVPVLPQITGSTTLSTSQRNVPVSANFTLTNKDSDSCPSTTFAISASPVSGATVTVQPASLMVGAGQSKPFTVTVTALSNLIENTYPILVTAANPNITTHKTSFELPFTLRIAPTRPLNPTNLRVLGR